MIEAIYIGATGMNAHQTAVDVISNNLTNVNTTAYKKGRVTFEDLMYRTAASRDLLDTVLSSQGKSGIGTAIGSVSKSFTLGELKKTENALDVAINGAGFLEVSLPDGNSAFTRAGALEVTSEGLLAVSGGHPLKPMIRVPAETRELFIDQDGRVRARLAPNTVPEEIGRIELVNFVNPGGLNPVGENLYLATERSGESLFAKPGEDGTGLLAQGFLESSNVSLVEEMVNLVMAQRAYEMSTKVVQAADEIMAMSNNLRR
jgi:flagellar basal-body rod protein FlgG